MEFIEILLDEKEQEFVTHIARKRRETDRAEDVVDMTIADLTYTYVEDVPDVEIIGLGGEVAVAKYLCTDPDSTYHVRSGGCDMVTDDEIRIDVKTTRVPGGNLWVEKRQEKHKDDIDVYVAVYGHFPYFIIMGWYPSRKVFIPKNLAYPDGFKNKPTYIVECADLYNFPIIMEA